MGIPTLSDSAVLTGSARPTPVSTTTPAKDAPPIQTTPSPDPTPPPPESADFTENDKNRVGAKLTQAIGQAFKTGDLTTEEELQEVSEDIITIIDEIKNYNELAFVLAALTQKWPFFEPILKEETSGMKAVSDIETAFKQRNSPVPTAGQPAN